MDYKLLILIVHSLVKRCPTMLPNLNFLDCLPYPGQSCDFKCKTGYRLAVATTVSCGSVGQWIPSTDALCEGMYHYMFYTNKNVLDVMFHLEHMYLGFLRNIFKNRQNMINKTHLVIHSRLSMMKDVQKLILIARGQFLMILDILLVT